MLNSSERSTESPVPNGTEVSAFDSLVDRYQTFARNSAENIIKLAETLVEAKAALHEPELRDFCQRIGLDGSTFRKRLKIGQEASRFEPFVDRLPVNWTTLYKLATLDKDKFDQVTSSERFGPMMTASEVELIIRGDSADEATRLPTDCFIHLDGLDRPKKLEVREKLEEFARDYGFKYTFSSHFKRELQPPKPRKVRMPKRFRPRPSGGPDLSAFL